MDNSQLWQKVERPQPSARGLKWLYLLSVLIVGAAMAYVRLRWDDIPSPVPTHWGADGSDAFGQKSVSTVFIGSFIGLGVILFMAMIAGIAVFAMQQHESEGQPIDRRLQQEFNRVLTAKMLAYISLGLAVMFAVLQVRSVLPEYQSVMNGPGLYLGIIAATVVAMAVVIWWTSMQLRGLQAAIQQAHAAGRFPDGTQLEGTHQHYKLGLFYYNPEDSRVVVERRFGVGIDFNYTHWQGKLFLALIVATTLVCMTLPFVLG